MKAIVLAAGRGERMRGYEPANDRPKVMLPMKDERPIIEHVVDRLLRYRFEPIIIAVARNTYGDQIKAHFASNVHVLISESEKPSGTAGEVYNARRLLRGEKTFLVYYGDTVADVDLAAMKHLHDEKKNMLTGCGARYMRPDEGMWSEEGETLKIDEKPLIDYKPFGRYPNCPIFYAEGKVLDFVERLHPSHPTDLDFMIHVVPAMHGERMGIYKHEGFYYNVGNAKVHRFVQSADLDF